jgi:galactokinase
MGLPVYFEAVAPEEAMRRTFFAPGRVNLIGEHTDYTGGLVLPAALDLGVRIEGTATRSPTITLTSDRFPAIEVDVAGDGGIDRGWGRYVAAVAAELAALGRPPVGFVGSVSADLPIGSGLSSSAALEVAVALALTRTAGFELEPLALARAAQAAEHRAVGVPCGLMDQAASILGRRDHAVLLDTATLEHRLVALPRSLAIVVIDSGTPRLLSDSRYAERRGELERAIAAIGGAGPNALTVDELEAAAAAAGLDDVSHRRLRHAVTENIRVRALVEILESPELDRRALGVLFREAHGSLRRDFEASTHELDVLVELAYEGGALGARMTGAGFGGAIVALCDRERASSIARDVGAAYRGRTGREAAAWVTRAADGARELEDVYG